MKHPTNHGVEAAHWALVLNDPAADPADIEAALNWIGRSDANARAMESSQRFLGLCDTVLEQGEMPPELALPHRAEPRRWGVITALAASLILALLTGLAVLTNGFGLLNPGDRMEQVRYASAIGENLTQPLPDGSTMLLSGGSAVSVSFDEHARRIDLLKGEVLFTVARNPHRPFIVSSGKGTATALGTAFSVHRRGEGATVTVVHGLVAVRARGQYSRSEARLRAAMQVSYAPDGSMSAAHPVNLDTAMAWQRGQLVFSGQPLAEVIADVNRYTTTPITIADPRIRAIPITGAVRFDNIDEWLLGLQQLLGVTIIREEGRLLLKKSGETPYSRT